MEYRDLTEENIDLVVKAYMDYYNNHDEGCWTYEKAYKRIHQIMTIEDSGSIVQFDGEQLTGFAIGFYKEYDDLTAFYIEEIVVFAGSQNKGYGTRLMNELERRARENGAEHLELVSVNDEHHMHFYGKLGYYAAGNLRLMGKHFSKEE